jgi:hypothetical protein
VRMVTPPPSIWRLSARSQRRSRANPKWESSPSIRRTLFGVARLQRRATSRQSAIKFLASGASALHLLEAMVRSKAMPFAVNCTQLQSVQAEKPHFICLMFAKS